MVLINYIKIFTMVLINYIKIFTYSTSATKLNATYKLWKMILCGYLQHIYFINYERNKDLKI